MPGKKTSKPRAQSARREIPREASCPFCTGGVSPDYKAYNDLTKFVTDRGKIMGGKRSGVCAKHQRKLTVAIKRARFLGFLPYTSSL